MPEATPSLTTTRRVLLAGAGLLTAGAPFAAAPGPDSAIIAAAARLITLDQQMLALTGHLVHIPPEINAQVYALQDEYCDLVDLVVAHPARTLPGLRAKAALLDNLLPRNQNGSIYDDSEFGRTVWSLTTDLLRSA